ncbi:hypothetical protein Dimus_038689 [Dionaea muscipula]
MVENQQRGEIESTPNQNPYLRLRDDDATQSPSDDKPNRCSPSPSPMAAREMKVRGNGEEKNLRNFSGGETDGRSNGKRPFTSLTPFILNRGKLVNSRPSKIKGINRTQNNSRRV